MAKIEFIHPAREDTPASTETIEVRVWGTAGAHDQPIYISSGVNYHGDDVLWLELIYSVEGAPVIHVRNLIQQSTGISIAEYDGWLDSIRRGEDEDFKFGEFLPETKIRLRAKNDTYDASHEEELSNRRCTLDVSFDTGGIYSTRSIGDRFINIHIPLLKLNEGISFMHELALEICAAQQGKHPDPATFAEGSSEWLFASQLNRRAYDKVAETYQEDYFENSVLSEGFDAWLERLPSHGQVLDVGCGHGQPVMARLIEKGFDVTGSDFSAVMLHMAGQKFPQARLIQQTASALTQESVYDGVCSFSSLLYLDPIDFLNSVHRLHRALKPDGLLFLYGYDSAPSWRGMPYHHSLGEWMWSWHYGMEEAATLLAEHGYFEVLSMRKVNIDPDEDARIAAELEKENQEEEEYLREQAKKPEAHHWPFMKRTIERSPYSYLILARRCER